MTIIKTKTLYPIPGTFSVSDPEIAYCKRIISVHRSGTQYFLVEPTGPPGNYEFAYIASSGDLVVNYDDPFNPNETVFVIYEPGDGEIIISPPVEPPPPTVCLMPGSVSVVVNLDYTVTVTMPEMGYFVVRITADSDPCSGTEVAGGSTGGGDTWISPVLPDGTYKACVLRQCPPSLVSDFTSSVPFEIASVPPPPDNFGARKYPPPTGIQIVNITGIPLVVNSGAFPLNAAGEMLSARHEAFTGSIGVVVKVLGGQKVTVALYKNGPLVQYLVAFKPTSGNVAITFNPISVTPSDNLFVALDYT